MKKTILLVSLLLVGCAHVNTEQTSTDTNGVTRTTKASGTTLFSSTQSIKSLRVSQTDKSQSVGAAGINQQGATNVVEALKAIDNIIKSLSAAGASGGAL